MYIDRLPMLESVLLGRTAPEMLMNVLLVRYVPVEAFVMFILKFDALMESEPLTRLYALICIDV